MNNRDKENLERAKTLLTAARDLLKKQEDSVWVFNVLEETVFYDDAVCDGSCLLEDIGYLLDDMEERQ